MTKAKKISSSFIIASVVLLFTFVIVSFLGIKNHGLINDNTYTYSTEFEITLQSQTQNDYTYNISGNINAAAGTQNRNGSLKINIKLTNGQTVGIQLNKTLTEGITNINESYTTYNNLENSYVQSIEFVSGNLTYTIYNENILWSWTFPVIILIALVISLAGMFFSLIKKSNKIIELEKVKKQTEEDITYQTLKKNAQLKQENESLKTKVQDANAKYIECSYCSADISADKATCHQCGAPLRRKK